MIYFISGWLLLQLKLASVPRRGRVSRIKSLSLCALAQVLVSANVLFEDDAVAQTLPVERVRRSSGSYYFSSEPWFNFVRLLESVFERTLRSSSLFSHDVMKKISAAVLESDTAVRLFRLCAMRAVAKHPDEASAIEKDIASDDMIKELLTLVLHK